MYTFRQPITIEGWINHIQITAVDNHSSLTPIDRYLFRKSLCGISTLKPDNGDEVILLQSDKGDFAINFSVCDPNVFGDITEVYTYLFNALNAKDNVLAQASGNFPVTGTVNTISQENPLTPVTATLSVPGAKTYAVDAEISNANAPTSPTMLQMTNCVANVGGSGVLERIEITGPAELTGPVEVHIHVDNSTTPQNDGQNFLYGITWTQPPLATFIVNFESSPGSNASLAILETNFNFTCLDRNLYLRFKSLTNFTVISVFDLDTKFYLK